MFAQLPVTSTGIPNNHLGYAVQWFAMALVLVTPQSAGMHTVKAGFMASLSLQREMHCPCLASQSWPPNWLHIPIGYNGRASTVVVSGPISVSAPPITAAEFTASTTRSPW